MDNILKPIVAFIHTIIKPIVEFIHIMMTVVKEICNEIKREAHNILIAVVLSILSFAAVNQVVKIPIDLDQNDAKVVREYIVNARTLKIHSLSCDSVNRMSQKNRLKVKASFDDLVSKGNLACGRCHAGLKRKNEIVANIITATENALFGGDLIDLPTITKYLDSIDEMGKWYVDNVSTYMQKKDEHATQLAKDNYEAIKNKLRKVGRLYCYPCVYLNGSIGGYDRAGDDCVRFWFSSLNNANKNFVNNIAKNATMKWSNISSDKLNQNDKNLAFALSKLGFKIYGQEGYKVDVNGDGYYELEVIQIDNQFKLQKGDILSSDTHIHVYLDEYANFGWGKVNNVYPQRTHTFVDYTSNKIICTGQEFSRVFRYVGNEEE